MWEVEIGQATPDDRRIAAGLHWAFMRHVMPGSPTCSTAIAVMDAYGLRAEADAIAGRLLSLLGDKIALVRAFFDCFPEVPRHQAALAYLNSITGTTYRPIPA